MAKGEGLPIHPSVSPVALLPCPCEVTRLPAQRRGWGGRPQNVGWVIFHGRPRWPLRERGIHSHSGDRDLGKTLTTRLCVYANRRISKDVHWCFLFKSKGSPAGGELRGAGEGTKPG